jgi:hypothetical protein
MDPTPRLTPRKAAIECSPEILEAILSKLSEGESLRSICSDPSMPDKSSIMRLLRTREDFRAAYVSARELGAEALADEVLGIATSTLTPEQVPGARVALDAAKWACSKFSPKRWGADTVIKAELSGPGGAPVMVEPVRAPLVEPEIAAGIKALLIESQQSADGARLQAILASDEPIDPRLFAALRSDNKLDGGADG